MEQKAWSFEECLEWVQSQAPTRCAGLFGPKSAMWLLMRENMTSMGAISAVLLQVAHPAISSAGAHGSRLRGDFNGRTRRTFAAMYEIIFGDVPTATSTIDRIHYIHTKIRNESCDHPYRATDPNLLFWVLATLIDSSIRTYELVAHPLTLHDREDFYSDMRIFGAAMGIPPDCMPETWEAFTRYFEGMLHGEQLQVGETGRKLAAFIMDSKAARWTGSTALVTGMLPQRWRQAYGLPWGKKEQRSFNNTVRVLRFIRKLMPASVRYCPAYHQALVRLSAAPRESRTFFASAVVGASRRLRLPWALAA